MADLRWKWLGAVPYAAARTHQEELARSVARQEAAETLLLLEHPSVFTLGRHRDVSADVIEQAEATGAPVLRTDRGGDLTWHGPGQLVVYPVVRLRGAGRGVRDFVAGLVEVMQEVAAARGVVAACDPTQPGLYVGEEGRRRKLASVGIAVRRGVTLHGAALNCSRSASEGFAGLAPCGLPGVVATSLEEEGASGPTGPEDLAVPVARAFAERFNFDFPHEISPGSAAS